MPSSGPHRLHQGPGSENLHHVFEVIGQDVETHLGADLLQRCCKEMCAAHPELDRPEGMLQGLTSDAHALKKLFILPASHATLLVGSALILYGALLAV